jgi:hypothetical protein
MSRICAAIDQQEQAFLNRLLQKSIYASGMTDKPSFRPLTLRPGQSCLLFYTT